MFALPVVLLCNTVLFVVLLEERFKLVATASAAAVAYIISLIVGLAVEGLFVNPAAAGHVVNAVGVLILFLVSVFTSSNNLTHKLFVGLTLITNYAFITDFVPNLLGALPFGTSGIAAALIANGIYIVLSILTAALFSAPLHYFFRRQISPSMVGLCLLQLLCWYVAKGGLSGFMGTDSFPLRFFSTVFIYVIIVFCFLSVYGGAKYKARDVIESADDAVMEIEADSFKSMLVNVNTYKALKKNLDYQLDRIGDLASTGKTLEILNCVELSKDNKVLNPLLKEYSDNPYVNAVVATKTAHAKSRQVSLESNIDLGRPQIRLVELCIVINDLLSLAIDEAAEAEESKFVRLNVIPTDNQLTVEAVYSESKRKEVAVSSVFGSTVGQIVNKLLKPKDDTENDGMRNIIDIVENHSGKINVTHSQGAVIVRIGVNY